METNAAFVWPDGAVELNAEAAIDLHLTFVVHPGNAEHELPFRLDNAFQDFGFGKFRILVNHRLNGLCDLTDSLMELDFSRVAGNYLLHDTVHVLFGHVFVPFENQV